MSLSLNEVLNSKNFQENSFPQCANFIRKYFSALKKLGIQTEDYTLYAQRTIFSLSRKKEIEKEFYNMQGETNGKVTFKNKYSCAMSQFITHENLRHGKRIYILNLNAKEVQTISDDVGTDMLFRKFIHEFTHILSYNCYTNGTYKIGVLTNDESVSAFNKIEEENIKILNEAITNVVSMIIWEVITGSKDYIDIDKYVYGYSLESKYMYALLTRNFKKSQIVKMYLKNDIESFSREFNNVVKSLKNEKIELLSKYSKLQAYDENVRKLACGEAKFEGELEQYYHHFNYIASMFYDLKDKGSKEVDELFAKPTMTAFLECTKTW